MKQETRTKSSKKRNMKMMYYHFGRQKHKKYFRCANRGTKIIIRRIVANEKDSVLAG